MHGSLTRALVATVAVAVVTVALGATVTIATDFRQVVAEATVIVRGHVTDVRSVELANRSVESIATVAVDLTLKGTADAFVSVHVPGGTIGRVRVVTVDAPQFTVGEQAILFLRRGGDNALRPVGLSLGVYPIGTNPGTGQTSVDPPLVAGQTAALGPVVHGDPTRRMLSIEEFESLVRLVLAGQAGRGGSGR